MSDLRKEIDGVLQKVADAGDFKLKHTNDIIKIFSKNLNKTIVKTMKELKTNPQAYSYAKTTHKFIKLWIKDQEIKKGGEK